MILSELTFLATAIFMMSSATLTLFFKYESWTGQGSLYTNGTLVKIIRIFVYKRYKICGKRNGLSG